MVHWDVYLLDDDNEAKFSYFLDEQSAIECAERLSPHFPGKVIVHKVESTAVWKN